LSGGEEEELEKARGEIFSQDDSATFDPEEGFYMVAEGDQRAVTRDYILPIGTKHFVCKTDIHILRLQLSANVELAWAW